MRELKFRVYGGLLKKEFKAYDNVSIQMQDGELKIKPYDWHGRGDDVVIEQYTGLKDKNGKEIYEGDIVDYNDDGECIGIVKYDAPEFYLDADATNWARMFLKGAPHQRVIGNIHENPELLDEKEKKHGLIDRTGL